MQQKDIFICHASEDKSDVVRPLYKRLEAEGFNIWYDEAEIRWGDSITERVNWGLIHSTYVLVVLSDSFLKKKWPNREFNAVVNTESSSGVVKVLPLVVGDEFVEKRIAEAYPLISDKRYLRWTNNQSEIVEELYRILPERNRVKASSSVKDRSEITFNEHDFIYNSDISIKVQKVRSINGKEKGLFIKADKVSGIPFISAMEALIEMNKGETLLGKYVDKAVWKSVELGSNINHKLFIEIPALCHETLFMQQILSALVNDSGIYPGNLIIVLPESMITSNNDGVYRAASVFRDSGFKIGITQFGSGYGRFRDLQRLDFSYLFMDSLFLKDANNEKESVAILRAICSLASSLKVISAIDHVENQEEMELLEGIGCQLVASTINSPIDVMYS